MKSTKGIKIKILGWILVLLTLCGVINQIFYLTKVQFICYDKLKNDQELNIYEIGSALQTHTNLWLFGWIVEPNTAELCFCKQFYCKPFHLFNIPSDNYLNNIKSSLKQDPVRLSWEQYSSKASIYLNGSYITKYVVSAEDGELGYSYYIYDIPCDYSKGIIYINKIPIVEEVFDYLENIGILSVFTDHRNELIKVDY